MRSLVPVLMALVVVAGAPAVARGGTNDRDGLGVVSLNVLHGAVCPQDSDACQLPDRMALLGQRLVDAGCPEIVGLQEVSKLVYREVTNLPALEECDYEVVFRRPTGIDHELLLTSLAVGKTKVQKLLGGLRTASRVQLRSELGPVVVVVTHQEGDLPAGQPGADATCTARVCPKVCEPGSPLYACQTTVAADLADDVGGKKAIRVLMGDFNVTPASGRYQQLVADGWVDTHIAAGNPECDPASGTGCTSGRRDDRVDDLKDPTARQAERIDFLFVKAPSGCTLTFDGPGDADGDGLGTGVWDDPVAGAPGGIVFVSDHSGTSSDLSCEEAA
jgi:endonuclease/exonuclease/phosphatase family metal-dependent hydrolase